jgi:hypothetical protein
MEQIVLGLEMKYRSRSVAHSLEEWDAAWRELSLRQGKIYDKEQEVYKLLTDVRPQAYIKASLH